MNHMQQQKNTLNARVFNLHISFPFTQIQNYEATRIVLLTEECLVGDQTLVS